MQGIFLKERRSGLHLRQYRVHERQKTISRSRSAVWMQQSGPRFQWMPRQASHKIGCKGPFTHIPPSRRPCMCIRRFKTRVWLWEGQRWWSWCLPSGSPPSNRICEFGKALGTRSSTLWSIPWRLVATKLRVLV